MMQISPILPDTLCPPKEKIFLNFYGIDGSVRFIGLFMRCSLQWTVTNKILVHRKVTRLSQHYVRKLVL